MALGLVALGLAAPSALTYVSGNDAVPEGALSVYQKNLYFRNWDLAATEADIRAAAPDAVTLQEVSRANLSLVNSLRSDYPTVNFCAFAGVGGIAVLSKWPRTGAEDVCLEKHGVAAVQVDSPAGPLWIASVHLHWPWPYGQALYTWVQEDTLKNLDGPVILTGDFNMVPWGSTVRRLSEAARGHHAGPTVTTLAIKRQLPAWLPIDHVYVPEGWRASQEVRPEFGSDHRGLMVRFAPP